MTDESAKVKTQISKFVDPDLFDKIEYSEAFAHLAPKSPDLVDQVVEDLGGWRGVQVYKKEDIPDHFGFRDDDR